MIEVILGIAFFLFIGLFTVGMIVWGLSLLLSLPDFFKERKMRKINRKYLKKHLSYLP
jgi:hypothetical protein